MKYTRRFGNIVLLLSVLFYILPVVIQKLVLRIYFKITDTPLYLLEPIRSFVQPFVIKSVLGMALQEMLQIRERDNEILMENSENIKLYYGAEDKWCPLINYYNIKKDIPDIDAVICEKGYSHTFVLENSLPLAALISNWIQEQ